MKKILTAALVAGLLASSTAFATNGYFSHGYSTKEKGMGGAGVAMGQDALSSATNPAALVKVGNRFDIGLAAFSPVREYTVTGNPSGFQGTFPLAGGTHESDNEVFAIPHIGANWMLNNTSSIGIAVYGNGGMNTEYLDVQNFGGQAPDGTFYGGTAGVDFKQVFINTTYSTQVTKKHALGISVIAVGQTFEATGLAAFGAFSTNPAAISDNDVDTSFGVGAKIGWIGNASDTLAIGASYQSKIDMSEFEDYSGLFAGGGDFDVPATGTIGIALNTSANSVLAIDVQKIYYSGVASLNNPMSNLFAPDGSGALGADGGAGFGWEDMTIVKVGYEFGTGNKYRVGVSHGNNPIPESEVMFNILAPAVMETHITAGATFLIGDSSEINIAGMYAPEQTVSGANPLEAPGAQTIDITMVQYELQVGYALKF